MLISQSERPHVDGAWRSINVVLPRNSISKRSHLTEYIYGLLFHKGGIVFEWEKGIRIVN
ncbi:hypothetical protein CGRA01v4_07837 [Colletotrichum graminicola]|nr:hypothetical protein CGRA01v4_07837 [Colletotrichum graminicola]